MKQLIVWVSLIGFSIVELLITPSIPLLVMVVGVVTVVGISYQRPCYQSVVLQISVILTMLYMGALGWDVSGLTSYAVRAMLVYWGTYYAMFHLHKPQSAV